jgi:hypothetical protein
MRGWMAEIARMQAGTRLIAPYDSLATTLAIYCAMTVLPFDERAAAHFDTLKRQRIRIGTQDLFCFDSAGRIIRWFHEEPITLSELLMRDVMYNLSRVLCGTAGRPTSVRSQNNANTPTTLPQRGIRSSR